MSAAFPFEGDPSLREPAERALHRVIDPEVALDIVELGLVYGVRVTDEAVGVRLTMTSAACPVTELIVADAQAELRRELGDLLRLDIEVVWDPPWGPERMSDRARRALGED